MRGTAVRGHTLGISVGNPLSVEPELDVFTEAAYESIDFAITAARIYGIKVRVGTYRICDITNLTYSMFSFLYRWWITYVPLTALPSG